MSIVTLLETLVEEILKLRRADSCDFSRGRKRLSTILLRHESKLATKFEASGGSQARKRKSAPRQVRPRRT